ncbi:hypothetical protein LXL04_036425 [Taraxacum kok-saghyz]
MKSIQDMRLGPALASDAAQQALDRVVEGVNSLAECCDKIAKSLSNCNATTGDIIRLELMNMMAVYQEGAYERLCRWVQTKCRRLGDSDNPEVSELLKMAVRCLKERHVLQVLC